MVVVKLSQGERNPEHTGFMSICAAWWNTICRGWISLFLSSLDCVAELASPSSQLFLELEKSYALFLPQNYHWVCQVLNETSSISVCVSEPFSFTLFSSLQAQMDLILSLSFLLFFLLCLSLNKVCTSLDLALGHKVMTPSFLGAIILWKNFLFMETAENLENACD